MTAPSSIDELFSAGVFVQAGIDASLNNELGEISNVEFNFQPAQDSADDNETDQLVQVRINAAHGPRIFDGVRVAYIEKGTWHWATSRVQHFSIPELHSPQPYDPALESIARSLVGEVPVFRTAQGEREAIVAIDYTTLPPEPRESIVAGLGRSSEGVDERLALLTLGNYLQQPIDEAGDYLRFSDGTTAQLTPADDPGRRTIALTGATWGLSALHVLADAHFPATEHQFFLSARFPDLSAQLDVDSGQAVVNSRAGSMTVPAHLIATVDAGTLTWAWADEKLAPAPAAQAAAHLRRFGWDYAIPDLLRPHLPVEVARQARLPQLAMPILGLWTLLPVHLTGGQLGLALSDAIPFRLPAASPAAVKATLAVPVPEGVDEQRARAAYAAFRGISLPQS